MNEKKKADSKWGWGIFVLYGSFVMFILSIVFYASFQNFELVEKDYYQKEMNYQSQIEKESKSVRLSSKITIAFESTDKKVTISFPNDFELDEITGEVYFFRPSNSNLDFKLPLKLNENYLQEVNSDNLVDGLWKIKINWTATGNEYYFEDTVIIK